jgi:8-oxo-dGTP pyrophosphatase MutT (NUDIX family)
LQRDRISAGTIIKHEGCLFMVRHVAHGGGIKGSESYEGAAAREVWEETSLSVRVGVLNRPGFCGSCLDA